MAHREGIREYLKDVQVHGTVMDLGCGSKKIQKYLKPNTAKFITIDKLKHVEADIVKNIEACCIELPEQADFAFCLEVIEHVWETDIVIENIYDNLKSGGVLYLSQPYHYVTHKEDDRIRYTHHGLKQLLEEHGFVVEDIQPTAGSLESAEGFILRARK